MLQLKLCKGKSYLGAVKATVNKPDVFVEDKKTAERLLKSGYFILVEETTEDEDTPPSRDDKKLNVILTHCPLMSLSKWRRKMV